MKTKPTLAAGHPIVLFDGYCNLCNGAVNFLIDHDRKKHLRFAPLQSAAGKALVQEYQLNVEELDTVILIEDRQAYVKSTAILRTCRHLTFPWPLFGALLVIPRCLRDRIYDWVARNRYAWFGRRERCRLPTPDILDRFLS